MTEKKPVHGFVAEPLMQVDTAVRGAANIIPTKPANRLNAATEAMLYGGEPWMDRYRERLALQEARDAYDAEHRPTAQAVGQAAGTLATLILLRRGVPVPPRLAGAAPLMVREAAALAGTGAGLNVALQSGADLVTGRQTSLGDSLGAAAGGAAGGLALPFLGPGVATGVSGWVGSAAQDILNGRPVSLGNAGQSTVASGAAGKVTGTTAAAATNRLSIQQKGRLGEAMGAVRSAVNGQPRQAGPKQAVAVPNSGGRRTIPDGRHKEVLFEDKFGFKARLSPIQRRAQAAFGDNFKLYHFTPDDVGKAFALPVSLLASHLAPPPGLLATMLQNGQAPGQARPSSPGASRQASASARQTPRR